mgnify:FL=1
MGSLFESLVKEDDRFEVPFERLSWFSCISIKSKRKETLLLNIISILSQES